MNDQGMIRIGYETVRMQTAIDYKAPCSAILLS